MSNYFSHLLFITEGSLRKFYTGRKLASTSIQNLVSVTLGQRLMLLELME